MLGISEMEQFQVIIGVCKGSKVIGILKGQGTMKLNTR
jgi:hypothetical protein